MKAPVIYKIRNVTNQKFYVGSTVDTRERFRLHRSRLRKGNHHCAHLQAAWNKYGEDCFRFEVVQVIDSVEALKPAEEAWLREHHGKPYCYNTGKSADAPWRGTRGAGTPNFGKRYDEEFKVRVSDSLKKFYAENPDQHPRVGKTHSEETKEQIRRAKLANPTRAWLGKERDAETRAKIGDAQRGKPKAPGRTLSVEGREKVRLAAEAGHYSHWQGRKHTEESRLKMSKPVRSTDPSGVTTEYPSLTALLAALGLKMPTLTRALKSGKPLTRGPRTGWAFAYIDASTA